MNLLLPKDVSVKFPDRLFIGGTWQSSLSNRSIDLISPDSEQIVGQVAEGVAADMDLAVAAARQAFDNGTWPRLSPTERATFIAKMGDALKRREPEIAKAWTAQIGVLESVAPLMTPGGTTTFATAARYAGSYEFIQRSASQSAGAALIVQEPVGVVAAIAPWNAPYMIMATKVAYALAAGCTVVMKPAPETPLEAYIIAEAAEAAGLPAGVVNLVCGDREASDHLVCNPDVDKVTFTGSTAAGQRIASVCGARIARCTLELGGKSAAIILDDFPIADAARILTSTIVTMSGQICAMLSRAIVSRGRHDELAAAIADEMSKVRIGHSHDPVAQLGPAASSRQLERIQSFVAEGRQTADLVAGGKRPAHLERGYFLEPTLFANVSNGSRIAQEEIFGPVLCLIPAEDEADAVRIANESRYGLYGSVMTKDSNTAYRIARQMRTGGIGQNGMRIDFNLPFGGFKQSGIGRENGEAGLLSFLESKTITLDSMPSELIQQQLLVHPHSTG